MDGGLVAGGCGLRLQRRHIYDKAVPHISFQHTFVGGLDILDIDHFDIGNDVVRRAIVQHFLGFGQPADTRPGEALPAAENTEGGD